MALEHLETALAPNTPLARVQAAWPAAVGDAVAAEASPLSLHDGALGVGCSSGVWAQELDLLAPQVVERLNGQVGFEVVRSLRCRVV